MDALDPATTFVHLGTGPGVALVPVGPDFWATLDQRADLQDGRLITCFDQSGDWDVWERHPAGDEVIHVLGGSCTFHLDHNGAESSVRAAAGTFVVVPAGAWHTVDVHEPGRILVMTWGEDTEHRPR
jgi:mannose-6-phosphate isomerase-like protein (cupin superfamily)